MLARVYFDELIIKIYAQEKKIQYIYIHIHTQN